MLVNGEKAAGRPSRPDRREERHRQAWMLRAYAEAIGMNMSVAAARALLEDGGDPLARLRAIRDAQVHPAAARGGWSMRTITAIAAAAAIAAASAPPATAAPSEAAQLAAAAEANRPAVPAGAVVGTPVTTVASADGGVYACGVSGVPWYVSSVRYIHVSVGWSCNGFYGSMTGQVNLLNLARSVHQANAHSGSDTVEFSDVPWYGAHNRPVWECPFRFALVRALLETCSTISYI